VIVKGCGKSNLDFAAYRQIAAKLTPVVKSLIFVQTFSKLPVMKRRWQELIFPATDYCKSKVPLIDSVLGKSTGWGRGYF
jgi:hypothetical protein